MSDVKCYPLAIPNEEFIHYWMPKNDGTFRNLKGCVAVHPTLDAQFLFFTDKQDRIDAYNMIHEAYPESLCAYVPQIAYIDSAYIRRA